MLIAKLLEIQQTLEQNCILRSFVNNQNFLVFII